MTRFWPISWKWWNDNIKDQLLSSDLRDLYDYSDYIDYSYSKTSLCISSTFVNFTSLATLLYLTPKMAPTSTPPIDRNSKRMQLMAKCELKYLFDGSIDEVDAVHIVEEPKAICDIIAVRRNRKTIDLISNQVVKSSYWTKKSIHIWFKCSHLSLIGSILQQKTIQLIVKRLVKVNTTISIVSQRLCIFSDIIICFSRITRSCLVARTLT